MPKNFHVLILAHGNLARELLTTAEKITGDRLGFSALALDWDDDLEAIREKVRRTVAGLEDKDGVLILADMFGSTPCNAALALAEPGRVEVVTGVNLPMVVRLGCLVGEEMGLAEAAVWLQEKGKSSICLGSQAPDRRPAVAAGSAPSREGG